ncbi:MAG: hypothetical protein DRP47_05340 [Candidatus Zixiibacteriota bacterium]|nr:MAG: hypothetical protein DRP47_05340 [candidate division Zixibacteria bacterium]
MHGKQVGNLIWVKRLIPLVILTAAWFGYNYYTHWQEEKFSKLTRENALVTARVWYISVRFQDKPEIFLSMRDSILSKSGLSIDEIQQYLQLYSDEPEKYEQFARQVSYFVDSLCDLRLEYERSPSKPQDSLDKQR